MTNLMFDLVNPKETSIVLGHYWYFHKKCSHMGDMLRHHGVDVHWGWYGMNAVLGRESRIVKNFMGDTQRFLKTTMPPGCYDQLYTHWLPALKFQPKPLIAPRPPLLDRPGEVYLIEAIGSGRIKIGRGRNAEARLLQLSTGTPFPLKLLRIIKTETSIGLEQMLHARYAQYRKHGEWFALSPTMLDALLEEKFL